MIEKPFGFYFLLKVILLSSLMRLMANCSFVSLIAAKSAAAWSVHFRCKNQTLLFLEIPGLLLRKADSQTDFPY